MTNKQKKSDLYLRQQLGNYKPKPYSFLLKVDTWRYTMPKYVGLLFFLIVLLFPFYEMIVTSLKSERDLFVIPPLWLPLHPTLANYANIWTYVPFFRYILNSIIIASGATLVNALTAIPASYALARFRFPGRNTFLQMVMIGQMFSPIVLLMGMFKLMVTLDLVNTYQGLILMDATVSLSFTVWLLNSYFSSIPQEIVDAALIDGAGRLRILFSLYIPLSWPGLVATIAFTFIDTWNEFVFALTFMIDPAKRPLTTGVYSFVGFYDIQWNLLMSGSLISVLPVFLLFLLVQRGLLPGLTSGAIK